MELTVGKDNLSAFSEVVNAVVSLNKEARFFASQQGIEIFCLRADKTTALRIFIKKEFFKKYIIEENSEIRIVNVGELTRKRMSFFKDDLDLSITEANITLKSGKVKFSFPLYIEDEYKDMKFPERINPHKFTISYQTFSSILSVCSEVDVTPEVEIEMTENNIIFKSYSYDRNRIGTFEIETKERDSKTVATDKFSLELLKTLNQGVIDEGTISLSGNGEPLLYVAEDDRIKIEYILASRNE